MEPTGLEGDTSEIHKDGGDQETNLREHTEVGVMNVLALERLLSHLLTSDPQSREVGCRAWGLLNPIVPLTRRHGPEAFQQMGGGGVGGGHFLKNGNP